MNARFLYVNGSGGYASDASKTALRAAVDSLSNQAYAFGILSSGDIGMIMALKASDQYAVVFRFTYPGSLTDKASIRSMAKLAGTWGEWISVT